MKRILRYFFLLALYLVLTCTNVYAMDGSGSKSDPYIITSATDLQNMNQDLDAYYELGTNISLNKVVFAPIGDNVDGAFTGSLDGNGYTISYLTLDNDYKYAGLFGYLEGSVSDVTLTNVDIAGIRYIGGIAGYVGSEGTISGCSVSGDILGTFTIIDISIGGIAGYCTGVISDCANSSYISYDNTSTSYVYVGGIVGYVADGELNGCENYGSFEDANYMGIGGVVGYATESTISSCANYADISSTKPSTAVGGIAYYTINSTISHCSNYGNISIDTYASGIAASVYGGAIEYCSNYGNLSTSSSYNDIAGIACVIYDGALVAYCSNHGNISSTRYASGIVYRNDYDSIIGCYNSGTIYGSKGAASILYSTYSATVSHCYNSGYISGYGIGDYDSDIYSCYNGGITSTNGYSFDSSESNNINYGVTNTYGSSNYTLMNTETNSSSTATLVPLEDFTNPDSFPTLDFENDWEIDPDKYGGMPMLRNLPNVVMLNRILLTMDAGDTFTLYGELDGTTKTGTWSSYDTSIASVSSSGKVTANSAGSTIITLTLNDGSKANCTILVYNALDSLSFQEDSISMENGTSTTPTLVESPSYATETIRYESSDTSIATVGTLTGTITAIGIGSTTITATGLETGATAQLTVNVGMPYLTSINISSSTASYNVGTDYTLAFTTSSSSYCDTLVWESSNTSILTVENGVCTPIAPGTAVVTVTTEKGYSDYITITVLQPSTSLTLLHTTLNMNVGETEQLVPSMLPDDTTDSLSYSSSSTSIVSVSSGLLTAKSAGTAVITVTATSGLKAYCTVTVGTTATPVTSVSLSQSNLVLSAENQTQVTATVLPETATNSTLVWTSSNDAIATVSQFGVITGQSTGTATITATASNGMFAQCTVQVVSAAGSSIQVSATPANVGETSTVTVAFLQNPGLSGYNLTIDYDSDLLEVLDIENQLSVGSFTSNLEDATRDALNVVWYHTANVEGDCTLFTMEVLVKEGATLEENLEITISNNENGVYNDDSELIPVYFYTGYLSVDAVDVGDIYEDNAVNANDASLLARYLTTIADLNTRQLSAADVYVDTFVDMKDIVRLAQVIVGMPLTDDSTTFSILDTTEPKILITPEETSEGLTYVVSIQNNPGIAGLKLSFAYDSSQIEVTDVVSGDMLSGNMLSNLEDGDATNLVVTWYDDSNITGDGIVFTISADKKADIAIEDMTFTLNASDSQLCDATMDDISFISSISTTLSGSAEIASGILTLTMDFGDNPSVTQANTWSILACYDNNGKMVHQQTLVVAEGENEVNLTNIPEYSSTKIFVVDESYTPLLLIVPNNGTN